MEKEIKLIYKSRFKESKEYINFFKDKDKVTLYGIIRGNGYLLECTWFNHNFDVFCQKEEELGIGVYSPLYAGSTRQGGSPPQQISKLFKVVFNIPVPKTDNIDSGLDVNYMIDILIKKYKFKIVKK